MRIPGYNTILLIIFIFSCGYTTAQVKPARVFGDHMVLQRNMPMPIWGTASKGEKITVSLNDQKQTVNAAADGTWSIKLSAMKAGGPYRMAISGKQKIVFSDIYIGEVWLCSGQSNMDMTVAREDRYWCGVFQEQEEVASANFPLIRVFDTAFTPTDTPRHDVAGMWEICSPKTVGHFSATAYFFARDIYQKYKIPIGLITTAYGASTAEAWISRPVLEEHPQLRFLLDNYAQKCAAYDTSTVAQQKYKAAYDIWKNEAAKAKADGRELPREPKNPDPHADQHNPAVLYNGMIAPLVPYAIRGALWYQGESNGQTAALYDKLMEALILNWRSDWKQGDFPFFYVQLANHQAVVKEPVKDDPIVLIRDRQRKNLSITNTGMVVAIDNANPNDPNDIHPKNKQVIGQRLARIAEAKVYGEVLEYSGPLYKGMKIEEHTVRILFDHTGSGLVAVGDSLTGFAIAGADKKFVWATAHIDGNTVMVSSPEVKEPVAVRYGWAKNPPVNLYNDARLPASPFRTDNED